MSTPVLPPQPVLTGALVELRPIVAGDAAELFASASDPEVWRWKLVPRPASVDEVEALITTVLLGPRRWPFVIRRVDDGTAIGSTTLANFDLHHGVVEMGFTWLDRSCWGQGFNEESKLLLLRHLFEVVGLTRVEWQVDEANERSIRALRRLGFTHEGTLRSRHVRPDGTRRNSQYFSLLVGEWPDAAARLTAMVAARNPTATCR